jgi:hypothetical protein
MPSAVTSSQTGTTLSEAIGNGITTASGMPVRYCDMQAAMNAHLSQPTGAGALDGQHGIASSMSAAIPEADMSSATACIIASGVVPAITGRASGANTRAAITAIADSQRMVKLHLT